MQNFSVDGVRQMFGGSDVRGSEQNFTIGQSQKIWKITPKFRLFPIVKFRSDPRTSDPPNIWWTSSTEKSCINYWFGFLDKLLIFMDLSLRLTKFWLSFFNLYYFYSGFVENKKVTLRAKSSLDSQFLNLSIKCDIPKKNMEKVSPFSNFHKCACKISEHLCI